MRLTVHVENAPFVERQRKVVGEKTVNGKKVAVYKPKKSKCIINTFSYDVSNKEEAEEKLLHARSIYRIAKWKSGKRKGKEMVYFSY